MNRFAIGIPSAQNTLWHYTAGLSYRQVWRNIPITLKTLMTGSMSAIVCYVNRRLQSFFRLLRA